MPRERKSPQTRPKQLTTGKARSIREAVEALNAAGITDPKKQKALIKTKGLTAAAVHAEQHIEAGRIFDQAMKHPEVADRRYWKDPDEPRNRLLCAISRMKPHKSSKGVSMEEVLPEVRKDFIKKFVSKEGDHASVANTLTYSHGPGFKTSSGHAFTSSLPDRTDPFEALRRGDMKTLEKTLEEHRKNGIKAVNLPLYEYQKVYVLDQRLPQAFNSTFSPNSSTGWNLWHEAVKLGKPEYIEAMAGMCDSSRERDLWWGLDSEDPNIPATPLALAISHVDHPKELKRKIIRSLLATGYQFERYPYSKIANEHGFGDMVPELERARLPPEKRKGGNKEEPQ